MTDPRHNSGDVRSLRGNELNVKSWMTETKFVDLLGNAARHRHRSDLGA